MTPLARLPEEAAVVVPPDSEFRTMRQLGDALRAEPRSIPIAGAGGGTVDHVIPGLLLKALGRRPLEAQFVSFPGGGATTAAVMGGQVKAAVAGWGEFEEHVSARRVRALATSGERRLVPDLPTLKENGYDVVATNWRGLFAAPGVSAEARAALSRFISALHALPAWKALLETRGWDDAFLDGDAFEAFLRRARADTEDVLKDLGGPEHGFCCPIGLELAAQRSPSGICLISVRRSGRWEWPPLESGSGLPDDWGCCKMFIVGAGR